MKKLLMLFIFSVVSLFLYSCGSHFHIITVKPDRSVHVETSYDEPIVKHAQFRETPSFYNDPNFKNKVQLENQLDYDVETIDSLGNCLTPFFNKDFFHFRFSGDTLIVQAGPGKMLSSYILTPKHLKYQIELIFPYKPILLEGLKQIPMKTNRVYISTTDKELLEKPLEVKILTKTP